MRSSRVSVFSMNDEEVPLYIHIYIYRPKAKHASSSDRDRAGEHHRRISIRVNNHDFDMQSLEGVTLPRTVAVRRLQ